MRETNRLTESYLARALERSRKRVREAEVKLLRERRRDAADKRKPGRAWRWEASLWRINSARSKLGWARRRRRKIAAALGAELLD